MIKENDPKILNQKIINIENMNKELIYSNLLKDKS